MIVDNISIEGLFLGSTLRQFCIRFRYSFAGHIDNIKDPVVIAFFRISAFIVANGICPVHA